MYTFRGTLYIYIETPIYERTPKYRGTPICKGVSIYIYIYGQGAYGGPVRVKGGCFETLPLPLPFNLPICTLHPLLPFQFPRAPQ